MTQPATIPTTPDEHAILAACRRATAHNHGHPILGDPHIDARGTRIRLSSWPRQQEALTVLRALGYAVVEDSRPIGVEHGEALLVTGWDEQLLTARVDRLERAVRELEAEHDTIATHAVEWFRGYTETGLDEAQAKRRTLHDMRRHVAERPGPSHEHQPAQPTERDIAQARAPWRDLLIRIAAAETALAKMQREHLATSEAAIDLFVEYRDCYCDGDGDQAATKALIDVREGVNAIHELAGYDNDPDWRT
jgi:hypothetical protein